MEGRELSSYLDIEVAARLYPVEGIIQDTMGKLVKICGLGVRREFFRVGNLGKHTQLSYGKKISLSVFLVVLHHACSRLLFLWPLTNGVWLGMSAATFRGCLGGYGRCVGRLGLGNRHEGKSSPQHQGRGHHHCCSPSLLFPHLLGSLFE